MKSRYLYIVLFVGILFIAAFLRLYQLGSNPPSLDWDEASLGYNAYSLLKTGKDEYGRVWPVSIRSFGDFKPGLYTYLTIPAVALFDLSEFAVRLPAAVMGMLTVVLVYFLVKELFHKRIALLVMFLLAISPWHLQFSRVAFESNVSLFFVFGGLWCYLKGVKNGWYFIPSGVLLALSFYSYHSPRLVVPLIILGWSIYYRKELLPKYKVILLSLVISAVVLIPFFKELVSSGSARFSSVTVLTPQGTLDDSIKRIEYEGGGVLPKIIHNRRLIYAFAVAKGYVDHFNFDFLFLNGDAPDRHHARDMGMLYLWEAPFVLIGLMALVKRKNGFLILWWFICAPAASAITTGTPHAVRALLFLPTYQIFSAVGLIVSLKYILRSFQLRTFFPAIAFVCICAIAINIFYYFQMYYVHTPIEASRDWQYGYKQAVQTVRLYENEVDRVVVTYQYDQPYIFWLFYNKVDPAYYQSLWHGEEIMRSERSFGKYVFRNIDWKQDQSLHNTVLVGTAAEIPSGAGQLLSEIRFLDGTIAFRIVKL